MYSVCYVICRNTLLLISPPSHIYFWRGLECECSPIHQHKLYNQGVAQARTDLCMSFHLLFVHHTLALGGLKIPIYFFYEDKAEEIWIRSGTI